MQLLQEEAIHKRHLLKINIPESITLMNFKTTPKEDICDKDNRKKGAQSTWRSVGHFPQVVCMHHLSCLRTHKDYTNENINFYMPEFNENMTIISCIISYILILL